MPPKSLPPAARQALLLAYLRSTRTCHTLRDLEKSIPAAVPSINGMQVKEYLQALTDEGTLRVEKIGTGNWYWSFGSEGRKEREVVRERLEKEREKVLRGVREAEERVEEAKRVRREEEGEEGVQNDEERASLVVRRGELEAEVARLKAEEEGFRAAGSGGMERMREEIGMWKGEVELWTDNIYMLEEYLKKLAGGDREVVEAIQRECYGDEYVEGEGLREI
ncbi:hypothetical protein FQN54_003719 [Arachnomyces sp. PD_36]|nr:hypothetical protein FQN54_003719 [Arachnomyces sp. PD_36]